MPLERATVDSSKFNDTFKYPFNLRRQDFELAMQDVYDFLYDINRNLLDRDLRRLDDMARKQLMSGLLSDLLTDALGTHARSLVVNRQHNGHPDLVVEGRFSDDAVMNADPDAGIEVKSTSKKADPVDTHGARDQWMCVFVYTVDRETEPATDREPTRFKEIYLAKVSVDDFRWNDRTGRIGTNTATLHKEGLKVLRAGWVYLNKD